jgi:hypothetical protein
LDWSPSDHLHLQEWNDRLTAIGDWLKTARGQGGDLLLLSTSNTSWALDPDAQANKDPDDNDRDGKLSESGVLCRDCGFLYWFSCCRCIPVGEK